MAGKRRKKRTPEQIKKDILEYLDKQTYPRTTGQIAEAVGIIWYKAHDYLADLREEQIIYHEKVGRQNQWSLMERWKRFMGYTYENKKKCL